MLDGDLLREVDLLRSREDSPGDFEPKLDNIRGEGSDRGAA